MTSRSGAIRDRSRRRALPTPELVLVDGSTAIDQFRVTESIPGEGRFLASTELVIGKRRAPEDVPKPSETSDAGSICAYRLARHEES